MAFIFGIKFQNECEAHPIEKLTSHTTVRTDQYTAVQSHKFKDSYQPQILKYPLSASLSIVMER